MSDRGGSGLRSDGVERASKIKLEKFLSASVSFQAKKISLDPKVVSEQSFGSLWTEAHQILQ